MKKETNYKAIFFTGITFLGTGTVFIASVNSTIGIAIMGLGLVFMVLGGKNKDKWKK